MRPEPFVARGRLRGGCGGRRGHSLPRGKMHFGGRQRLVVFRGFNDDAISNHGVLEEGTEFLDKPITPSALTRKVREMLDGAPGRGSSAPSGGAPTLFPGE